MSTLAEIESAAGQLPREQKLRLMESLWGDLSRQEEGEWASPAWHGEALAQTERRLAEGAEEVLDRQSAREELRQRKV